MPSRSVGMLRVSSHSVDIYLPHQWTTPQIPLMQQRELLTSVMFVDPPFARFERFPSRC